MAIRDYFKPVPSWSADETRAFLRNRAEGDYNLVDVRQPGEYEQGHIPGALLIPLGELPGRLKELDTEKPTVTYCGAGVRSRAGAAILINAGFPDVHNLSGGMNAWHGVVAEGPPEAGMAYFSSANSPAELIALSYLLEDGTRTFYSGLSEQMKDHETVQLFHDLTRAEDHHKTSLVSLYRDVTGSETDDGFPWSVLSEKLQGGIMEGGMSITKALNWAEGKDVSRIIELAISAEANSYDLYIRMERFLEAGQAKKVFKMLAEEERLHLDRLIGVFEQRP